ncbi:uncharacterized protein TRUGW13939_08347 [Talaromyces rugulosus]|uniref:Uncharacterized protein n=1 Tax=Talaromyces rugulosus TaxID=121627 RepID=A0A7H8R4C0_TALRU|nr:uncharacterized protein TRUGW13939_08347 [Talaromyces rugulosus]QKX61200.1 hypothetical protein TRUGW13939_08347 [Talaromyces rugulosus]
MFGSAIASISSGREAWIRRVIFFGLHLMLLQSLTQCVCVLYLYGTQKVDESMTPSLIIGLVASFLSVPFVILHTILSWQYRKIPSLNIPRNALHIACSHLPRVMIVMWLSAAVAGLVIVSKQASCVTADLSHSFWQAGTGCQIHRGLVIISILAFFTVSTLFCCFQVSKRPYDASLLSMGAPQRAARAGSIFSDSSWESEALKHEIFYLCRHPDAGPGNGELYWSPNDSSLLETPVRPPSIRYSGPNRARPQLHVNTRANSVRPSISTSPTATSPRISPLYEVHRSTSTASSVSPLSRNPSLSSSLQPGIEAAYTKPLAPVLPDIAESPTKPSHTRQKSSVSSRRFLPRAWTVSEPLSDDPQIRALASPPLVSLSSDSSLSSSEFSRKGSDSILPSPIRRTSDANDVNDSNDNESRGARNESTEPKDAPVLPPVPFVVRKPQPSNEIPKSMSIHHPHHPNYVPSSAVGRKLSQNFAGQGSQRLTNNNHQGKPIPRRNTSGFPPGHHSNVRHHPRSSPFSSPSPPHVRYPETQSPTPLPRRSQSQYRRHNYQNVVHPQPRQPLTPLRPAYTRRFHSNDGRGFDPARALPPIPCSEGTATLYPSTRRPRSSTYGGFPGTENLGESMNKARARTSLNLADGGVAQDENQIAEKNTYRGAERTSMCGGG